MRYVYDLVTRRSFTSQAPTIVLDRIYCMHFLYIGSLNVDATLCNRIFNGTTYNGQFAILKDHVSEFALKAALKNAINLHVINKFCDLLFLNANVDRKCEKKIVCTKVINARESNRIFVYI